MLAMFDDPKLQPVAESVEETILRIVDTACET